MTDYRAATAAEQKDIDGISAELKAVIGVYGFHPKVQSELAKTGYISIDMVSVCYTTETELSTDAPP